MTGRNFETGSVASILDVVAGLLPGDSAADVARAAVREATKRGARVRFVQLLAHGPAQDGDDGGFRTFEAALAALRESPRVPVSFEIAAGEPGPELVRRSRGAGLVVVADHGSAASPVAEYCRRHAGCEVWTTAGR